PCLFLRHSPPSPLVHFHSFSKYLLAWSDPCLLTSCILAGATTVSSKWVWLTKVSNNKHLVDLQAYSMLSLCLAIPTQPLALTSLLLPMAEPANCTGTQAYFCDHCKVKRTKTSTPSLCARAARSAHPPPQSMTKSNLSVVALYSTSYTSSKKLAPCVACYKLMFSNLIRICLSNNSYGTCSHRLYSAKT
ncbi:hypothetical protein PSTT_01302, partial [Puccinia striiformis]